jgi:hypothetical protein
MFEDAEALELKAPETATQLRDPLMLLCRISHQLDEVLVWLYVIFSEGKTCLSTISPTLYPLIV